MKNRKILSIVILLFMLLNTSIILAISDSNNPDYNAGYSAGLIEGMENFASDPPISAAKALNNYRKYEDLDNVEDLSYFIDGFYDGYEAGLKGIEVKVNFADILGTTLGGVYGTRDFQNNKSSNWKKALPSDKELGRMYNLDMETREYKEVFLTAFKVKFVEGYTVAYEKANLDPKRITLQTGIKDGENLGKILGNTYGAKDYYENKTNDFERNLPSDRDIIIDYFLNNDYAEYKEGFISGFKAGYEAEYNKIFREANVNNTLRDEKDAYLNGKALGFKSGEMRSTNDYMEKKTNNWKRSQPISIEIILEYNLTLQSENYRQGFISGFYDGYSDGYNITYQKFAQEESLDKSIAKIIPISGGVLSSLDNIFTVSIDKGTFYNSINLTIDTLMNNNYFLNHNYIKGSEAFKVNILNTSGNLDNEKPIELKFEYYGDPNKSGIYKFVNNKWVYINSEVEDGYIKTLIKPNTIKNANGIYAVLLNKDIPVFHDIRGHWAKDEINTLIRRSIINGYSDKTFKPDNKITRAEFLTLLSRVYDWKLPSSSSNTAQFKDYARFGNYEKIISYAISAGYIKGYDDNTFRPHDLISYKEIEIIMGRAVDKDFKWYHTSAKMLYEKKVRASSYDSINNKINRGEVSYMLYILNQGKF